MTNKILMAIVGFNVGMFLCWLVSTMLMDSQTASGSAIFMYYLISVVVSLVAAVVGYFVGGMIA